MADTKHPADVLADCAPYVRSVEAKHWRDDAQEWLRRIPTLEAERDQLRAEVQRWSVLAASFEAERNLLREEISDLHKANAARKQQ